MSHRNLPRDADGKVQDTFDSRSLNGASSTVGFLGVRTLGDTIVGFVAWILPFGRLFV